MQSILIREKQMKTRTLYKCSHCKETFEYVFNNPLGYNPAYNQCPLCGIRLIDKLPTKIPQKWIHERYKGWWIFKISDGHWENEN